MEGTNMEPLGAIASRSASQADRIIPASQVDQTGIAETDSARRKVTGKETESSPFPSKEASKEKIDRIARALENFVRSVQTDLSIKVHRSTGKIMVQVISKADGKVIREIPPEGLLDLAAKMEEVAGVIFDKNA
jgi:flagellar protein FlaG